jgi:hypothetical protein
MMIKKVILKNTFKIICLIFSGWALFVFPKKITGINELSKKK